MSRSFLILFIIIYSNFVFSANGEHGKNLFQKCIECHGSDGMGLEDKNAPRIAGQHDWYLIKSLKAFKSGERSNPPMMPFINELSEQDFEDLVAYISIMHKANN